MAEKRKPKNPKFEGLHPRGDHGRFAQKERQGKIARAVEAAKKKHPRYNVIVAKPGQKTVRGTSGRDIIITRRGTRRVIAGRGGDVVLGQESRHLRVKGGRGADEIRGGSGKDSLSGGAGNDQIVGGFGADKISGGAGNDDLHGQNGPDRIRGGTGKDHITGSSGNDRIFAGGGRDAATGGPGDDVVYGGAGDDVLHLFRGNDRGYGGPGFDWIGGYTGNDIIVGGPGTDIGVGGPKGDPGHDQVDAEIPHASQHVPGHPLYNPPDDRRIPLPHLHGPAANALKRAIMNLRHTRAIRSDQAREAMMRAKSRLFHAAQREINKVRGTKSAAIARWKLDKLQEAYSSEVDRLTVEYEHWQHDHGIS